MKTSTVLKRAKKQLAKNFHELTEKEPYICCGIETVIGGKMTYQDSNRVRGTVQNRLAPYSTLEGWLRDNHGIYHPGFDATDDILIAHKTKMQETRHAWIDSMIEEFEAQGD
jgi:hypothetical protein